MSKGIYWKCLRCDFGHIEDECPNCGWHTRGEFDLPPQRTWVGLTNEDVIDCLGEPSWSDVVRKAEAKLKQKNGYAEEKKK